MHQGSRMQVDYVKFADGRTRFHKLLDNFVLYNYNWLLLDLFYLKTMWFLSWDIVFSLMILTPFFRFFGDPFCNRRWYGTKTYSETVVNCKNQLITWEAWRFSAPGKPCTQFPSKFEPSILFSSSDLLEPSIPFDLFPSFLFFVFFSFCWRITGGRSPLMRMWSFLESWSW